MILYLALLNRRHWCFKINSKYNDNFSADGLAVMSLLASINHKESVYIRLTGGANSTPVYKKDYQFKIGKAVKLVDGNNVAIFKSVSQALKAAEMLKQKNRYICN